MKKILAVLVILLFSTTSVWAGEGGRLVLLVWIATEPASKAQFYNPEGNTDPIKVTFTITDQGAEFVLTLLPTPTTDVMLTTEPIITGE